MDNRLSFSEWRYRREVFSTVLRWALIIAPASGLICLIAFRYQATWTTLVMAGAYFLFTLFIAWCLWLLRQQKMQPAVRIFVAGGIIIQALFGLFAPENLLVIGAMALALLALLAVFMEPLNIATRWGVVSILVYLLTLLLRQLLPIATMALGPFAVLFLYGVPVIILSLTVILGYIMTNELREALGKSEGARQALARSYADAAIQTEALEKSETRLSELASKLERSNSELKTLNEELKSFAYIISHDLRTPLINLKGFAAELRSAVDIIRPVVTAALGQADKDQKQAVIVALDEDVPEALGFIDASVTRMEHFINAILKLSRLGRRELNFEPLDMDAVVRATLQTLAHRIEQRQVNVTVGPLPSVVADRLALEQIMSNILTNAVDYLEPNRSGEIAIAGERHEDETIFYIRDNGQGIAAENMPKVFEPFRRIGKQDIPGEGMGLAYVQTLVRRHGGRIWCESEVAVGTTFIFTLSNHLKEGEHDA